MAHHRPAEGYRDSVHDDCRGVQQHGDAQDMFGYFKERNADSYEKKDKEPFNIFGHEFLARPA